MRKPNYTPEMIAVIKGTNERPFNKAIATDIARRIEKSPRSVIAKIKSMGLPYAVQRPVRKDGSAISRKIETVAAIAKALDMDLDDLDGLTKAPRSALIALLREIP
jgi:hypothetical protein